MRSVISLLFLVLFSVIVTAQQVNIIPEPYKTEVYPGKFFTFSPQTTLGYNTPKSRQVVTTLNNYIKSLYGITLKTKHIPKAEPEPEDLGQNIACFLEIPNNVKEEGKQEFYDMLINDKFIMGVGEEQGLFYSAMTLLQLLPPTKTLAPTKIQAANIMDAPRFAYRGMHLDVGRHFFPLSFIKKYIDYLAYHKFNTFHWHLTEDQGWRIEIKKYPRLTSIGGFRNGTIIGRYPGKGSDNQRYGGFYTQAEIKEVVKYAKERFIDVIPEIEMPGHGSAAIAAYPWLSCFPEQPTAILANMISRKSIEEQKNGRVKLVQETWGVFNDVFCAGKDSTFLFLQNVLDEVIPLFPSKYVHIGGDECPKVHWKTCPLCQQRMKAQGLKDEHELQSYFIQRIEKYLNSKGKTLIGWDEILEGGLAPKAVVMSWRGEAGGIEAAKQKHNVIMTPGNPVYFDHTQSLTEDSVTIGGYNPIEKVYAYEPVPKELSEEDGKFVLGAQANVWTEYMKNTRKVEYMIFPRISALSEVLWSPKGARDWEKFEKKLPEQFKRYDKWKTNYSKAYFDLKTTITPADDNNGVMWKIDNKNSDYKVIYTLPGADNASSTYTSPVRITTPGSYMAALSDHNNMIAGNWITQTFSLNKATGKKITLAAPATPKYPGDGAFTLVNGIQNEKGMARTQDFLGFEGLDCIATIDLGAETSFSEVVVHHLEQTASWIYAPSAIDIAGSNDGVSFSPFNTPVSLNRSSDKSKTTLKLASPVKTRFIKVSILNHGKIAEGNPGAGHGAWLFVDEIEVR